MVVYKYLAPARIDVLEHSRIRFTQPAALNDPFESLPCLTYYKARLRERMSATPEAARLRDDPFSDPIHDEVADHALTTIRTWMSERFAFLSLSKKRDHLLMWSHYADSHHGFVIGFDSSASMFAPGNLSVEGLREVVYSRKRWVLPADGLMSMNEDEVREANIQFFFTKSVDWEYEEELRLLADPRRAQTIVPVNGGWSVCLFDFPAEMVHEIIFGTEITDDLRKRIVVIAKRKHPHVKLFQAKPDPERFGLQFVPLQWASK